ncbi:MAG: 16S rRNA (cytosine(1402)-N(4))-methyltransferase RsmH [Desulfohalobium sp.]
MKNTRPSGQIEPPGLHQPVMCSEVLQALAPRPGGRYLDGTVGLGGHSAALAAQHPDLHILGLDRDTAALEAATARLAAFGERVHLVQCSFSQFEGVLDDLGWEFVDGALVDLGVSSLQLDTPERGFSFVHDGPLDMRMDSGMGAAPARSLLNKASQETLRRIIREYGEEPMAGRIAKRIVATRGKTPFTRTLELAQVVEQAYPAKRRAQSRNHPATKTFQALRIAVNKELEELEAFLEAIPARLRPGARVAVIAFHSLEDRIVKHSFRREAKGCRCPKEQPMCMCGHHPRLQLVTKKPLIPSEEEMAGNPRSRSAKLRVAERIRPEATP